MTHLTDPNDPGNFDGFGVLLPGEPGYTPPQAAVNRKPVGPSRPRWNAQSHRTLAGILSRYIGSAIDNLVVQIPAFVILFLIVAKGPSELGECTNVNSFTGELNTIPCEQATTMTLLIGVCAGFLVLCALSFFVVIEPIGTRGSTIGMKIMGVRAVDIDTGQPIGLGKSAVRFLVAFLPFSHFLALFSKNKQTLHDMVVRSVVEKSY